MFLDVYYILTAWGVQHKYKIYDILCACFLGAGHFADSLITRDKWTMLSVRRLMTGIGLLGPGLFILFFSAVNNLPLAVM